MIALENENEALSRKFLEFQNLIITLTKSTTKNNFLSALNIFSDQVSKTLDKKIDLSPSFDAIESFTTEPREERVKVQEEEEEKKHYKEEKAYSQEDIQKCKIGEDIVHDPYYTTKLINKMRLFNVFKMGCKRLKFEAQQSYKVEELNKLHPIQDAHITQTDRESLLRDELIKTQE